MKQQNLIASAAIVALLGGCASTGSSTGSYSTGIPANVCKDIKELRTIAGIYAGALKVETDGQGRFRTKGTYSPAGSPEAMARVLREADTDGNKTITSGEARILLRRVEEQYVQKVEDYQSYTEFCRRSEISEECSDFYEKTEGSSCGFYKENEVGGCNLDYIFQEADVRYNRSAQERNCSSGFGMSS
mgnify:FL=1